MKSVKVKTSPTVEANRDQNILEQHGIKAAVVPHYKSPSYYTGDTQMSDLLVRDDQLDQARSILGLKPDQV